MKTNVANFKRRILKARCSFSVMGDMLLTLEIDAMTPNEREWLSQELTKGKNPVIYSYLESKLTKDKNKQYNDRVDAAFQDAKSNPARFLTSTLPA